MTDINVNPCEEEIEIDEDEDGTGTGESDSSEPAPPVITLDRVSFPERRITSPVPLSERNVTILNSVNFFEASRIRTETVPGEPLVRYADGFLSNVLEIDAQLIREADSLPVMFAAEPRTLLQASWLKALSLHKVRD